jgi:hypothetical protein
MWSPSTPRLLEQTRSQCVWGHVGLQRPPPPLACFLLTPICELAPPPLACFLLTPHMWARRNYAPPVSLTEIQPSRRDHPSPFVLPAPRLYICLALLSLYYAHQAELSLESHRRDEHYEKGNKSRSVQRLRSPRARSVILSILDGAGTTFAARDRLYRPSRMPKVSRHGAAHHLHSLFHS